MDILENRDEWLSTFRTGWLAHFQETGEKDWKRYNLPKNSTAPAGPGIDLSTSRLMLITTAGGYLRDSQRPFDDNNPLGDYSIRTFPSSTPLEALAFAHGNYDHAAVEQDPQVLVPLRHLDELVSEGVIDELAPSVISCAGYQPDATRVVDDLIPAMVEVAQEEEVNAVVLVPA